MENKSMKIIAWILLVVIVTTLISSMFFTAETYKIKSAKNQNLHEEKVIKQTKTACITYIAEKLKPWMGIIIFFSIVFGLALFMTITSDDEKDITISGFGTDCKDLTGSWHWTGPF